MRTWRLECSACDYEQPGQGLATLCPKCGQPFLVEYDYDGDAPQLTELLDRQDMWRYAPLLPLEPSEVPVSLGEGATPLLDAPALARKLGVNRVWIKEEGLNPTGSFKARGMSAAVTRAKGFGVSGLVVPTAGNAGAALAAYGAAAGLPVRVYAPRETPAAILNTIRTFGAELYLVEGHIGDAGKEARTFAAERGYFDVSTLREPYRIEGKKTMGLELAEQLDWSLPTHIIYPTGGGTGLIGMWKVFRELGDIGWLSSTVPLPKMIVAQASGCAPIVRAHQQGAKRATPWEDPRTHAAGLRVPGPLGDRLILHAVRSSGGDAVGISEDDIRRATNTVARETGIDVAPEGGCAYAVLETMVADGRIERDAEVVVFNTGSGASYRT
ncbi:MAG TPA: threonine synthase [Gemmatimonadaceae bacterium]|nr:threonine synthase [Gemmatimonadaceae bacterium]